MRPIEALYSDGLAMGRATLLRLLGDDGNPLILDAHFAAFWSEHSERATLPSLVGLIDRFSADWLDLLGRWAGRMADVYIRTQRSRVGQMQIAAATEVRSGQRTDLIDESDIHEEMRRFGIAKGIEKDRVETQITRLIYSRGAESPPTPTVRASSSLGGLTPPGSGPDSDAEPSDPLHVFEASSDEVVPGDGIPGAGAVDAGDDAGLIDDEVAVMDGDIDGADVAGRAVPEEVLGPLPTRTRYIVADPDLAIAQGTYVISIRKYSRLRRLHRVGGCHLRPGVDYLDFENHGDMLPAAVQYHHLCKRCFATGAPATAGADAGSSSSSCSAGSTSDSDAE